MNNLFKLFVILCISFISVAACAEPEGHNPVIDLKWQKGPILESIDGVASLQVPKGYYFLDKAETDKYLELSQNIASGKEYLFTSPDKWEAYFRFSKVGYVKDDEKIDPDDLLDQYKKGTAAGNEERVKKGWPALDVDGWFFKPHYDKEKTLLEWAFLLKDSKTGSPVVNYYTRILGRNGVMEVILVATPDNMQTVKKVLVQ